MKNRKFIAIIALLLGTFLVGGCFAKKTPQAVQYTEEEAIPYRIVVLPAKYVVHEENSTVHKSILVTDEDKIFVAEIVSSAIANQLAGKGFMPLQKSVIDNALASVEKGDADWTSLKDEELCALLQADGVVKIDISSADMIKAVAFDLFQIDAGVSIVNREGMLVGKWSDSAVKRRVSVPTGVLALAGTIVSEIFSDPVRRQMRMVVYDWAWNLAQMLPDCPKGPKLPEVIAVDTNVDNRLFGVGQKIVVRVDAEPGLSGSFDIGEFKKNLPLPETSQGVYEGLYVVREGDRGAGETMMVKLRKANGISRLWLESGSQITVDGILPEAPVNVRFMTGRDGVELRWNVPQGEELSEFIVEKSSNPVGGFESVVRTREDRFIDLEILQGTTVFYRVRSVDKAGNLSAPDGMLKVVFPQFDERELLGELSGTLVKGNYVLNVPVTVPEGARFIVTSGSKIRFAEAGRIDISGEFEAIGDISSPIRFVSNGTSGINIHTGSKAILSHCELSGFKNAVHGRGGFMEIRSTSISSSEKAVIIADNSKYDLTGLRITGASTGITIKDGKGVLQRSGVTNCTVGIDVSSSDARILDNNIYDNETNIKSMANLVLATNYLGSSLPELFKIYGRVLVKSILDAPYPYGRKVVLVDDKAVTPEVLEKRFNEFKEQGTDAFHKQHYGDAYQSLSKALEIRDDRDIYLYLSYTLLALKDDLALSEMISEGISKFPYDVRMYHLYVRYLISKGDIKHAREVLEQALKLSPSDSNILYFKDYLK